MVQPAILASSPHHPNTRPTLALLTTDMWHSLSAELWRGVRDFALANDLNLICFAGGEIGTHHTESSELANVLYDLVSAERVQGLAIWTGALGNFLRDDELRDFCTRFQPLPIIGIGRKVEGYPLVDSDGLGGLRKVLGHLIQEHGCRRIVYIRGPEENVGAEQRYHTYLETLAEHGIPFAPELVTPPADWYQAHENLIPLLRERQLRPGIDFQAIAAVSDVTAAQAIKLLQQFGVGVPQEVAVVGLDGEETAKEIVHLHITTAPLMLYEQGFEAAKLLLARLRGEAAPEELVLPCQLLIGQTCGCLSATLARTRAPTHTPRVMRESPAGLGPDELPARRVAALTHMREALGSPTANLPADWAEQLWDTFVAALQSLQNTHFLPRLAALQEMTLRAGFKRWGAWQNVISALRQNAIPALTETSMLARAEDLCQQARLAVAEAETRRQVFEQRERKRQDHILRLVGQSLISQFDMAGVIDSLAQDLPRLNIPGGYLSLYEDPAHPAAGARLILALNERGRLPLPPGGRPFPSTLLAPDDLLPHDRPYSLIAEALFFGETQIGLIVFEVNPKGDEYLYDALRRLISSPLKGALLVKDLRRRTEQLEQAYEVLKENQEKLLIVEKMASLGRLTAGIAHELNTPLAASRTALRELDELIREYESSIHDPNMALEDHQGIVSDMRRAFQLAARSTEQAAAFVNSIKAQTRDTAAPTREPIKVAKVAQDVLLLLGHMLRKGRCEATLEAADNDLMVYGALGRLVQVITNLVTNAIEASAAKGGGPIKVRLAKEGDGRIILQVADKGSGIPAPDLPRIFDPMFTTKRFGEATGLGLTIVHNIVIGDFGGDIEVDSRVGEGTTFTVIFPPPASAVSNN